ncbi:cytochrome p450 [Stylonychia lemnae]|uniref:Cytochrome p450 n=1 Tax=Stylonychia lemnae TaxID=5949 RepID=A0A078ACL7_STYLE|nr:cytochrome p450 [Stylonychia lemnae]|eukprot:CDW79606.1 cytochrome p450 [Stylonychia lemnae]
MVNEDFSDQEQICVGIELGTQFNFYIRDINFPQSLYQQNKVKFDKDPSLQSALGALGKSFVFVSKDSDYWKKVRPAVTKSLYTDNRDEIYEQIKQKIIKEVESNPFKLDTEYNYLPDLLNIMSSALSKSFYEVDLSKDLISQLQNGNMIKRSVSESLINSFKVQFIKTFDKLNMIFPFLMQYGIGVSNSEQTYNQSQINKYFQKIIAINKKQQGSNQNHKVIQNLIKHIQLPDEQLSIELCLFWLGILDNTLSSLNNTLQLLASNPTPRHKLEDLIQNGSQKDQLEYARLCILESLRMFSTNPFSSPQGILSDGQIGEYYFKKGDIIRIDYDYIHYHKDIWQRPQEYIPERFDFNNPLYLQPNGKKRGIYSFLAFGSGKRICPGADFIENVGAIFLIELMKRYRFENLGNSVFMNLYQLYKPNIQMMVKKQKNTDIF